MEARKRLIKLLFGRIESTVGVKPIDVEITIVVESFMPRLNADRNAFRRRTTDSDNDTLWTGLAERVAAADQGEQITDSEGRVSTAKYEQLKKTTKSWMLSYFSGQYAPSGVADLGYSTIE